MLQIKTHTQSRPLPAIASHAIDYSNLYHLFPTGEGPAARALGPGAWEVAWCEWGKAHATSQALICLSVQWVSSGFCQDCCEQGVSVSFFRGALHHIRTVAGNKTDIVPVGGESYISDMETKRIIA